MNSIFDLKKTIDLKRSELETVRKEFISDERNRCAELNKLEDTLALAIAGGNDIEKLTLGKEVLFVQGVADSRERAGAVQRAIDDLLSNSGFKLQTTFMGVKQYDAFGDQGCDCSYGYGPTHGSIVFSVGLKPDFRKKSLTEEELVAGIYYLTQVKKHIK